ncbi:hypothetical protein EU348_00335 [Chryseobacterium indologenes]|uniref:Uncharacterized protein n=1 Tax=Chryseobacterium indologenes TaxID=253 RepID=A0A411DH14_CHRID|nr:hypothetical protein EU348_00335 [Chryseobacterium indologenes]
MKNSIAALLLSASVYSFGQVGIGTSQPDQNAVLELASTEKGLLPPRLSTAERDAIAVTSAEEGLTVYNTDNQSVQFWNGTAWTEMEIDTAGLLDPVPSPDLGPNYSGAVLPYTANNATASGSVNGKTFTATFSGYLNVRALTTTNPYCNVIRQAANNFLVAGDAGTKDGAMTIKFDRNVSNLKVFANASEAGETFTFTLKRNGAAIAPVATVSPAGSCNVNFSVATTGNTITTKNNDTTTNVSGMIFNIGGEWFDEIEIKTLSNAKTGQSFNFTVGSVL